MANVAHPPGSDLASKVLKLARCVARDGPAASAVALRTIRRDGTVQRFEELAGLAAEIRRIGPSVVLEVGTFRGGTLWCWARCARADATLVTLDVTHLGTSLADHEATLRACVRPKQTLYPLVMDSHDPATVQHIKDLLAGRPVDYLFIDGDHSYAGVARDFELYSPLVRRGGLIAFHDIRPAPEFVLNEVPKFWEEIRSRFATREFVGKDAVRYGMGIGMIPNWQG